MPYRATARRTVLILVASTALGLGTAGGLATAPAAYGAALPLLSCLGTETVTYTPPLTNTSRPTLVQAAISLGPCLLGGVTSGRSSYSFTAPVSCTSTNVLPPAFSDTYQWNNGSSSAVNYTASVTTLGNGTVIITDTGTVTSGLDHGAVANVTTMLPELNLGACAGAGVSQQTGTYVLTFS